MKGLWTALITPLKQDGTRLTLDEASFTKLFESQLAEGVEAFVIAGSTGEGSLLGPELYEKTLRYAHKVNSNRVPLYAGLGIGGTQSALENLNLAQKIGFDGVLASAPAYIKAPQRGLREHFLTLSSKGMDLCLYEIAGRAAVSLEVKTIEEILNDSRSKTIRALKDASGDMKRLDQEVKSFGNRLTLLSGDDGTFAEFMKGGGHGVISVATHVAAAAMKTIYKESLLKNFARAAQIQEGLKPLIDALFWESNPIPVKSLLHKKGVIAELSFCPPLVAMDKALLEKLLLLDREYKSILGAP